jgi:hypothetical protein
MDIEKIRSLLKNGTRTLSVFLGSKEGDPRTLVLRDFLNAFQGLDRVTVTEFNASDPKDEAPFLAFSSGTGAARHFYQAVPTGLEWDPFLSLVGLLTRPEESGILLPETTEALRTLTKPLTVKVLIGPSCPFCAFMTDRINRFAVVGESLRARVIDVDLFPEYGRKYRIKAVPATIIEEEAVLNGMVAEEDLTAWLKKWGDNDRVSLLYRQDLLEKRLDQAFGRLRSRPMDLPFVAALLREDAFGVKLGAVALLEQLVEEEMNIHGRVLDALVPLLDDPSPQVVGDAAYLLGLLQDERKIPLLRALLHHPHREVAEIAREGLEDKG